MHRAPPFLRKATILGPLYFAQGLPFGFFILALPVIMRSRDYDLASVGLSSALALPWALKFLWAPLVDRFYLPSVGRRRSWLIPLSALTVALFLALALLPQADSVAALSLGMLAASFLAATQDIATDGLAVELLDENERGIGNALQVGGYRVGMIVGGGALLIVYDHLGARVTFVVIAALLASAMVPVVRFTEPSMPTRTRENEIGERTRPPEGPGIAWSWLALLVGYKVGESLAGGMSRAFLADAGLSLSDVGALAGFGGSIAGILGAILGGIAAGAAGGTRLRRALFGCGVAQAVGVAGLAIVASMSAPSLSLLGASLFLEQLTGGMATTALFTAMMGRCRPGHAAADYTRQACAVVIGSGLAATLSGVLAEHLGYVSLFGLASLLALLGAAAMASKRPGTFRASGRSTSPAPRRAAPA